MTKLNYMSCPICGFLSCIEAEKCECMKTGRPPVERCDAVKDEARYITRFTK